MISEDDPTWCGRCDGSRSCGACAARARRYAERLDAERQEQKADDER